MMKYLFVCVHPDDLEFSCGNLMAYLTKIGAEVHILSLTKGEFGIFDEKWKGRILGKIRMHELKKAAAVNGIKSENVHFGDIPDGFTRFSEEHVLKMMEWLNILTPDIVFAPEPYFTYYWHIDHINCGRLFYYITVNQNNAKIPLKLKNPIKWLYLYTTANPNFAWPFSDPTTTFKALYQHQSQWWLLKWNKLFYPIEKKNRSLKWKKKVGSWKFVERYRRVGPTGPFPKANFITRRILAMINGLNIINPPESHYKVLKENDMEFYREIEDLRRKHHFQ